jgi:acetyl esterase/lipase
MLGSSSMVNNDQIVDCLQRGWIVVVPNHQLCPQVNLLEGPIADIRDLSAWIHEGHLDEEIRKHGLYSGCDLKRVIAFGTSAGGHLSLCLGFDHKYPPAAILDFYGPSNFGHKFWGETLPLAAKLPKFETDFMKQVFGEDPIPTQEGVSLEGQQGPGRPDFSSPRVAFALTQIVNGRFLDACFPSRDLEKIDPALNIHLAFPPTCIVHGDADTMVPMYLSKMLFERLKASGPKCDFIEVPGEEHTFAGKMTTGSQTWNVQRKGFAWVEAVIGRSA